MSSTTWLTACTTSWCPINTLWRPKPVNAMSTSTSRGCCPTCHARMLRKSRYWSMSSAWSCKSSSAQRHGIIAFDPSSFPKRGTHSVGVKRQWCGHRGKVDTCQVGVYMGYVSRHDHALLDFRLSLPQEWARDAQRRQACHVPEDVSYRTRHDQCLEMLDLWRDQVPHGWGTGDDELGRHTRFRGKLRARGERYVR